MNTYTAALDALDVKRGHVHTVADWHQISEKAQRAPADLTDDDLIVLEGFGGPSSAAAARARREQALNPAPPAPVTKAAPAVTRKALMNAFSAYTKGTVPVFKEIFQKQKARIDELEARLTALEAKPHVKFCGTWERGKTYEPGNDVVRDGGLWICKATTPGEPSKDFAGWQLAVKKGSAT